jgi:hypothetical protein
MQFYKNKRIISTGCYVIERYVDPGYRFSGLWSFARYMMGKRR